MNINKELVLWGLTKDSWRKITFSFRNYTIQRRDKLKGCYCWQRSIKNWVIDCHKWDKIIRTCNKNMSYYQKLNKSRVRWLGKHRHRHKNRLVCFPPMTTASSYRSLENKLGWSKQPSKIFLWNFKSWSQRRNRRYHHCKYLFGKSKVGSTKTKH